MNRIALFVVVALIGSAAPRAVVLGGIRSAQTGESGQSWLGAWTLNLAKSKYSPYWPAPHSEVLVVEPWNGELRQTITGESAQGKSRHNQWIGNFDGRDYPYLGDSNAAIDTFAYRRIDDRTLERIGKKGGEVTGTATIVLSRDGKTRTLTVSGKDSRGQLVTNVFVYDKQ